MPHLPPVTIRGGSVKIRIPVNEVNDNGEECGEPLFKKKTKRVTDTHPPDSKKKYASEVYSLADRRAQIYSIEIYGADEHEVFEFRPKDGNCTIEIYYAISDELPLKHETKWLEPGEELCPKGPHEHKQG